MNTAFNLIAVAAAILGVGLLRAAWTRRDRGWRTALGWTALAAGALAWRAAGPAWDKAIAYAALAPSLTALAWLTLGAEVRGGRPRKPGREAAPQEPAVAGGVVWPAIVRALLAGPLAGGAALGLAVAVALRAPWEEADRLVAAGFVLPLAWAVGGVWAMTDPRTARAAAGLAATAGVAFAGALL